MTKKNHDQTRVLGEEGVHPSPRKRGKASAVDPREGAAAGDPPEVHPILVDDGSVRELRPSPITGHDSRQQRTVEVAGVGYVHDHGRDGVPAWLDPAKSKFAGLAGGVPSHLPTNLRSVPSSQYVMGRSCAVCGAQHAGNMIRLCHIHTADFLASPEFQRWSTGSPAQAVTALADFVRRVQAEERNRSVP